MFIAPTVGIGEMTPFKTVYPRKNGRTHTTFCRRLPLAQAGATRPHTTGYQRRLSPDTNTLRRTLSPTHIKAKSQCDQTTLRLAPLITPGVSTPAVTTIIVSTPSDSQQTIISEDKPLTSTFPCCTLPKHSQLQVSCRFNKVLQVL